MFDTAKISDIKDDIGLIVRAVRKRHDLTQIQLADRLEVSRITIQNLEAGKNFTINTLLKVLKELEMLDRLNDNIQMFKKETLEVKSLY